MFDRFDAMFLAAPVMLLALWLAGIEPHAMIQRLALLGATGSIGASTVEVVRHHPDRLSIATLGALGRNPEELLALAREFRPLLVAVVDPAVARDLRPALPPGVELASGPEALLAAATHPEVDKVVAAIVGAAGLPPVAAALAAGKAVALANKESLVVAGRLLTDLARRTGAEIVPIDSEHVALHQALRCGTREEVRRLVLTASGGPFLDRDPATFATIRPEEALRHPTWSMGAKISIDSATLINKGLELIEASPPVRRSRRRRSTSSSTRSRWCIPWSSSATARGWRSCRSTT